MYEFSLPLLYFIIYVVTSLLRVHVVISEKAGVNNVENKTLMSLEHNEVMGIIGLH